MRNAKQALTMTALIAVFVGGTFWGIQLLTAQADTVDTTVATCKDHTVKTGEKVTTNLVSVNVLNSSQKSGLANRVQINMQRNGFLAGKIGNSPKDVKVKAVTIITDDRKSSPVRLVAKQFKNDVDFVKPTAPLDDGVTIVIGDGFDGLKKKAARSVKANEDLTVCVPLNPTAVD